MEISHVGEAIPIIQPYSANLTTYVWFSSARCNAAEPCPSSYPL